MSLTDKKNALFGGKSNAGSSSSKPTSNATSATASALNSSISNSKASGTAAILNSKRNTTTGTGTLGSSIPSLTSAQKLKKVEEAKELSSRAMKYLKTSVFNWNPDHLAAAPLFEQSAELYKQVGEYDIARALLLDAAKSHESINTLSAAAVAIVKAAKIASECQNNQKLASQHFQEAANLWAINGSLDRSADVLKQAAKELENINIIEAIDLAKRACELLCPLDTPKSSISSCHPTTLDTYREYFRMTIINFNNSNDSRPKVILPIISVANRMVDIFEAYGSESSMCKMMLTVTFLQLTMGDVVAADQTFLQDHLNNRVYIKSKECELAEDYINAFKMQDIEKLESAQRAIHMNYLDKEVQVLGKKLTLLKIRKEYEQPNISIPIVTPKIVSTAISTEDNVNNNITTRIEEEAPLSSVTEVNEFEADENELQADDEDEIDLS